jgi:hypothetical protein
MLNGKMVRKSSRDDDQAKSVKALDPRLEARGGIKIGPVALLRKREV